MTKKNLWLGILAIALVLGMAVVGCGGGDSGGGGGSGGTGGSGGGGGSGGTGGSGGGGDGDGGGGGTFTLTGIPSQYNGKYAVLTGYEKTEYEQDEDEGLSIFGFKTANMSTGICTYPVISNGSVSIPLWFWSSNSYKRYSGNHTLKEVAVGITSDQSLPFDGEIIDEKSETVIFFDNVTFSKGSATRSWSQGHVEVNGDLR